MGNTPPDFDFDEWAELHRRDPEAFEARKQAMLALELAKGTPAQARAARQILERFERENENAPAGQRLTAAGALMLESMGRLAASMEDLGRALDAAPGRRDPGGPSEPGR